MTSLLSPPGEPEKPLISIVVPAYNEQGNIDRLYEAVKAVLDQLADRYDYEFVFTDNHSTDNTFAELSALAERDPNVRVFRFARNFGFQRSILTAYRQARGDCAVQLDCDLQDPPELILDFVKEWESGYKVVYGVRKSRKEGFVITLMRKIFYRLIDFLSEHRLPLDAGDFRLIDRLALEQLRLINDYKPYLRGALATMGFRSKGVPYDRAARELGESKFSLRDLFGLALDGILSHSTVPLRLATYTGLVISVLTFLTAVGYLMGKVLFGKDWPAGFATLVFAVLLSLSLNALFLGVIGEYIGRIYHQVLRRPLTIIEHAIDAKQSGPPVREVSQQPEVSSSDEPLES